MLLMIQNSDPTQASTGHLQPIVPCHNKIANAITHGVPLVTSGAWPVCFITHGKQEVDMQGIARHTHLKQEAYWACVFKSILM